MSSDTWKLLLCSCLFLIWPNYNHLILFIFLPTSVLTKKPSFVILSFLWFPSNLTSFLGEHFSQLHTTATTRLRKILALWLSSMSKPLWSPWLNFHWILNFFFFFIILVTYSNSFIHYYRSISYIACSNGSSSDWLYVLCCFLFAVKYFYSLDESILTTSSVFLISPFLFHAPSWHFKSSRMRMICAFH